ERGERQHRMHAGRVRDEVHELGVLVQTDDSRHREPRAPHAERDLVEVEREPAHYFTAPAVTPAATYRCATTSNTAAGIDATTAVAMIAFQSCVLLPM